MAKKRMRILKVKGTNNPADLGTKHLKVEDIDRHLAFSGVLIPDWPQ